MGRTLYSVRRYESGSVEPFAVAAFDKLVEILRNRRGSMTMNLDLEMLEFDRTKFAGAEKLKSPQNKNWKSQEPQNFWDLCARSTSDRARF